MKRSYPKGHDLQMGKIHRHYHRQRGKPVGAISSGGMEVQGRAGLAPAKVPWLKLIFVVLGLILLGAIIVGLVIEMAPE